MRRLSISLASPSFLFRELNIDASVSTVVDYLVWIAAGSFLFSIFLMVVLAVPLMLDSSARARLAAKKAANTWQSAAHAIGAKMPGGKQSLHTSLLVESDASVASEATCTPLAASAAVFVAEAPAATAPDEISDQDAEIGSSGALYSPSISASDLNKSVDVL